QHDDIARQPSSPWRAPRDAGTGVRGVSLFLTARLAPHDAQRIVVAVDGALPPRDDRVVGDVGGFGAGLRAALCDVAEADPALVLEEAGAVDVVDRVHLEAGRAHEEARPGELVLELVRAQHVAHVLAQEALDALAEFLRAIDVRLLPAPCRTRARM